MTDAWSFRPGTLDQSIFDGVVALDEYRLPERFGPDDIVVDVGAHIGSFAYAVVLRGGKHVWSIEPDRANCASAADRPMAATHIMFMVHSSSDSSSNERLEGLVKRALMTAGRRPRM